MELHVLVITMVVVAVAAVDVVVVIDGKQYYGTKNHALFIYIYEL